jgi:signal transduction histidine kinase
MTIRPRRAIARVSDWLDRVRPPAEVVTVIVADAGRGIAEEDRERIFEPFYTTKAPGHGTGLGLAIAASIVDSLQGAIWVERAREGGAAFHMIFPVAVPPIEERREG